jgi:hypothetical protein
MAWRITNKGQLDSANRASVMRCRRSLLSAVGCCCYHRCCHLCPEAVSGRGEGVRVARCPSSPGCCDHPHLGGNGTRPVRAGSCLALVFCRSARRGSGVKRDFACAFTRRLLPVLVVLRPRSRLMLEGRARALRGPSPDRSPARTLAPSSVVPPGSVLLTRGCGTAR